MEYQSIDEWVSKWMYEWINEWTDEWIKEWMNEWMRINSARFMIFIIFYQDFELRIFW